MIFLAFEGTEEDFWTKLRSEVKAEITANESKKVSPLTYTEACNQLGITNKTLMRVRKEMNITDNIYQSDILRILVKYPKYIKKAKAA